MTDFTTAARRGARAAAAAAAIGLLLSVAGCEDSTAGAVEDSISGTLETRNYDVEDVTCPKGLEKDGDSVTCQVTIGGKEYPVKVSSQGSGGTRGLDVEMDDSALPEP